MKKKKGNEKSIMLQLRGIRDKLSAEMQGMTPEQIKEFINSHSILHLKAFWDKKKEVKK